MVPVSNPGVQDCGAPVAFAITGRTDERLPLETEGLTPDEVRERRAQTPCNERVHDRLILGTWCLLAFLGLAVIGAVLGLVEDRLRFRRAPRFEALLRERPADAPGEVWDRPVVPREDIGATLPEVESIDVEALAVWSGAMVCVLLIVGGLSGTWETLTSARILPLLLVLLLVVIARGVAALDLDVLERGLLGRRGMPDRALLIALACDWAGRIRPSFGAAGVQSHALVRHGVERSRVLVDVGVEFSVAAVVHAALVLLLALAALVGDVPDGAWPPFALLLALAVVAFAVVGVVWLPVRFRRLPCTLGRETVRRLRDRWSANPVDVLLMAALAGCLPVIHGLVVLAAVRAFDGGGSAGPILLVVLLALAFGAFSPVPDGTLAVEAVLVLGLSLTGVEPVAAVAAALVWRAAMYWLPMIPGYVVTRRLEARGTL